MDLTITKHDMQHFMDILFPKGYRGSHTFDIFTDIVSVYEDNKTYTYEDFLRPFVVDLPYQQALEQRKRFSLDEIRVFRGDKHKHLDDRLLAGTKVVKLFDHIEPVFFVSLAIKNQRNVRPCRDVAGRIFDNYDVFKPPKHGWELNYKEWYGENWRDWRYRWFLDSKNVPLHFTLSESEHAQSDWMYDIYERAKWEIGLLWSD